MVRDMQGIATIVTAVVAFGLTAVLGIFLIPFLKKLKYGQTIKEIGPSWHKNKQGTPTMGGIMFIVGIIAAVIVGFLVLMGINGGIQKIEHTEIVKLFAGLIMALGYG